MAIRYYPAIIERGEGPGFGVFFPDLPGCTSAGETIEAAARSAEEALGLHLRGMIEDGDPLPDPTPLDRIEPDPEIDEACRVLVRADLPGKTIRFNATMDEGLLSRIDAAARAEGMSRSGFLAVAAREKLG
ncbi:type II toxin-antitoxin system HicB family antitoxin [Phaeospirillum tilakii]|uniref:Type II toxin-antitoxin system HicB family antitoxin n=1 Tax=Phaeospirillum tilakii TaxID=741673 RepID=A0ABW5C9Y4_9PROT